MPARQPFTRLCRAMAQPRHTGRADLHVHSTHSDGTYTPAELVDLARRSGLAALALTDHDTLGGVAVAHVAAVGSGVEIIRGVEITAEYRERELHLLGYFVRPEDSPLTDALERLRVHRVGRFREMVERLRGCGVSLQDKELCVQSEAGTLGRRHLAMLLVESRQAGSVREAFTRFLGDGGRAAVPKLRLPVAEALALVRGAGGVAAWAHPSYDCTQETLAELRGWGLSALEAEYPAHRPARMRHLRGLAAALGLAVTGGSDCHGDGNLSRAVGACGVTGEELEQLRQLAGR